MNVSDVRARFASLSTPGRPADRRPACWAWGGLDRHRRRRPGRLLWHRQQARTGRFNCPQPSGGAVARLTAMVAVFVAGLITVSRFEKVDE